MKGLVMRSTGSWYDVLTEENKNINCRVRGKIRLEGIKETNPIAVGDYVLFDIESEGGIIYEIVPRKNYIVRQSVKKAAHSHVIASNIDQAVLIATLVMPRTSMGFIDRFLVAAESFRIPQVLVFNKRDLLDEEELAKQRALMQMYQSIGVTCLEISALTDGVEEIKSLLQGKVSLVAGHSGVGKSTLLNKVAAHINQKTSIISDFSEKGTHTTTFAEMFRLDEATFVIDTPGVKELGLVNMNQQEISDYFPEMRETRLNCKFGARCIHLQEPKCAVIDAVQHGQIAVSRYESYVSMVLGEDNRK
jgi:ribosome biogenesis GTPase